MKICTVSHDLAVLNRFSNMERYDRTVYDNSMERRGLPAWYNRFIADNSGWLVFIHHDFAFLEDVSEKIESLDKGKIWGVIGVPYGLAKRKRSDIIGRISCGEDGLGSMGEWLESPRRAGNVDCCCIIVHSDLLARYPDLRFDEALEFHQYAEEFCIHADKLGVETWVFQCECAHYGKGSMDQNYERALSHICAKLGLTHFVSTCNKGL